MEVLMKKSIAIFVLVGLSIIFAPGAFAMDPKASNRASQNLELNQEEIASHSLLERYIPGFKTFKKIIIATTAAGVMVCFFSTAPTAKASEVGNLHNSTLNEERNSQCPALPSLQSDSGFALRQLEDEALSLLETTLKSGNPELVEKVVDRLYEAMMDDRDGCSIM